MQFTSLKNICYRYYRFDAVNGSNFKCQLDGKINFDYKDTPSKLFPDGELIAYEAVRLVTSGLMYPGLMTNSKYPSISLIYVQQYF